MAAGDLKRRQAEREAMREARKGQGINNANTNGSRIPSADDRMEADQQRLAAQKQADAIRAGNTPGKPVRSANTNNPNPDMSPVEAARRRTEMYENDRRSRAGQPLIGSGITSSNLDGDPTRVGPKPSAATTPSSANKPPAATPNFVDKPDGDSNGVPDSIQAGGPAAQPKPAAAAKPAEPRVSMINGEPAHIVLARMRGEATERAEKIKDPNQREAAMPFGPTLQERQTEQAWNAKQALEEARNKPTSPAAPPKAPAAAAEPRPDDGKTTDPVSPAAPPKAPASASTGPRPDAPVPNIVADTLTGGLKGTGALLHATNVGAGVSAMNAANKAAGLGQAWHTAYNSAADLAGRAKNATRGVANLTAHESKAAAKVGKGVDTISKILTKQKTLPPGSPGAQQAANRLVKAQAGLTERATNLTKARTALQKGVNNVGHLVNMSDEAATASNAVGKSFGAAAKAASTLGKVSSVAGKANVPVQVALGAIEGGRLIGSEEHRQRRIDEYAGMGAGRRAVESALNPVAGLYTAGHEVGQWAESAGNARQAEANYNRAKAEFDRTQALMAERGITKDTLNAMSPRDRYQLMKSIRAEARR